MKLAIDIIESNCLLVSLFNLYHTEQILSPIVDFYALRYILFKDISYSFLSQMTILLM